MLHSLSVSLLFPSLTQPHSPSSSSLPLTVSLNPTSKLYVMWCISFPFFSVLSLFHFLCQCWSPPPHASSFLSLLLVSLYLSMESTQFCNNRAHFVVAVFSLHLWSHISFPAFRFWKIIKRRSHKVKGGSALSWASRGKVLVKEGSHCVQCVSSRTKTSLWVCDSYRMFCILEFTASNLGIKKCLWK